VRDYKYLRVAVMILPPWLTHRRTHTQIDSFYRAILSRALLTVRTSAHSIAIKQVVLVTGAPASYDSDSLFLGYAVLSKFTCF